MATRGCLDEQTVVSFVGGQMAEPERVLVEAHLDTCNPCLERYDLQRTVKSIVARSCTEAAPDELRAKVLFRIREVQVQIRET